MTTLLLDDDDDEEEEEDEEDDEGASPSPLLLDAEDDEKEEGEDDVDELLLFFAFVEGLGGFATPSKADRFLLSPSPAADASWSFEAVLLLSMVVAIGCIGSNNIC
jgi:hypothetical protein